MSDLAESGGKQVALRGSRKRGTALSHPTVLEFESPTQALIALPIPFSARLTAPLMAALVFSTIAVTAIIPVDKVVTAQGKVVAKAATLVVQPLDTSIIRSIDVIPGESVKAGQVLARLDPTLTTADAAALRSQVNSYQAEVDRLQAEAAGRTYIAASDDPAQQLQAAIFGQRRSEHQFEMAGYREKISSLESQVAGNLAAANFYRQRMGVAQGVEDMRKELERLEVGSRLNSLAAVDNRLEMARNLATSSAAADTGKRDLLAAIADRDRAEQDWRAKISQDLTDQGRKLSDAREELKKAQLHQQLVELRAPKDSTVLSIAPVSEGSVLQSGDKFITLVPADAPLEVESYILGRDSGYVGIGDPVTVKFDTFSFTQYGYAEGTVRIISADSFNPQGAMAPVGEVGRLNTKEQQASADPMLTYKATISLDDIKLHDTPAGFHLTPGMPITADIKVGKRTVLSYLMSRVMPVAHEGMREP